MWRLCSATLPFYTMTAPQSPWSNGGGETRRFYIQISSHDAAPQKRRPIDGDGNKVLPFNLEIHREEYELKYPCCLCADGRGRTAYIECAVYSWRNKDTGQFDWTARCASDECGYQGQHSSRSRESQLKSRHHLVKIDTYFRLPTITTFQYPRRGMSVRPRFTAVLRLTS